MNVLSSIINNLNAAISPDEFREIALRSYSFHKNFNPVYRKFLIHTGRSNCSVNELNDIVFLPVTFFKENKVIPEDFSVETVFRSSTTSGSKPSQHYIADLSVYKKSLIESFRFAWGEPSEYTFLALLPSYLERNDSSLVFMMRTLMDISRQPLNGFYLNEYDKLAKVLEDVNKTGEKCIFTGVSFALCDFAEKHPMALGRNITVMETGGMKGRSNDLSRDDLHKILCNAFSKSEIAGEYGMTELLSQSYSAAGGLYKPPPWVKVSARDVRDPFTTLEPGEQGSLNIIDLANFNSCPFIATDDTGIVYPDGSFIVTGRITNSDIRGCNLMV